MSHNHCPLTILTWFRFQMWRGLGTVLNPWLQDHNLWGLHWFRALHTLLCEHPTHPSVLISDLSSNSRRRPPPSLQIQGVLQGQDESSWNIGGNVSYQLWLHPQSFKWGNCILAAIENKVYLSFPQCQASLHADSGSRLPKTPSNRISRRKLT